MPPLSEWGKQTVTKKNDQNILVKQQPKLSEYTQQPYQLLLSMLIGADGA